MMHTSEVAMKNPSARNTRPLRNASLQLAAAPAPDQSAARPAQLRVSPAIPDAWSRYRDSRLRQFTLR
jgi:hypothetical protein